uniref:arogenate dehydratase n=1 Tax=Araucaria cunninghamii TaxID=56994 RepID=A0A0D6QYP0_ARACU
MAIRCLYRPPARATGAGFRKHAPVRPKPAEGLEAEKAAILERLERIYRDGEVRFEKNKSVLFPPGGSGQGRPVRVAYQGVRGSYCQEAAVRAFRRCDAVPCCEGMDSAFAAVESGSADRAVVPVENSLDGVIERNYDLMLRHPEVRVVGELLLPINHCLLGVNGGYGIKRVVSHPQALAHCQVRLADLGVEIEAVDNAATAARFVAENGVRDTGVIGSSVAGREFGLRVIEENMQDDSSNTTRFFVLGKEAAAGPLPSPARTTVAFSLEEGTAALYKALEVFAAQDVKVSGIQSRPLRENPIRVVDGGDAGSFTYFEYVFFVDLEVSVAHPAVEEALAELGHIATFVRVLGSYSLDS